MITKPVTAEEFVEKIGENEKRIRQKMSERVYWEELTVSATSNTNGVKVKSSSDGTTLQKQIAEIVLIDQEIQHLKNDIVYRVSVIGELPADEYVLLHQVYVQHMSYKDICKNEKKSYSWAMKLRCRALKSLQTIINTQIYT